MGRLEIKQQSRQIPNNKTICANKKYYDILYAYLQCISEKDSEQRRYFYKKDVNFSAWGERFGLTRQTISTKFKNLKELGLVIEKDKDTYELVQLSRDLATLVQKDTLNMIIDTLNDHSISVYVYLLDLYFANNCQPTQFTLDQIKSRIGISTTTRSNNDIITNILFVLQKIGLIKYSMTAMSQDNDTFKNIKTIYQLEWLTNDLKEVLKTSYIPC